MEASIVALQQSKSLSGKESPRRIPEGGGGRASIGHLVARHARQSPGAEADQFLALREWRQPPRQQETLAEAVLPVRSAGAARAVLLVPSAFPGNSLRHPINIG